MKEGNLDEMPLPLAPPSNPISTPTTDQTLFRRGDHFSAPSACDDDPMAPPSEDSEPDAVGRVLASPNQQPPSVYGSSITTPTPPPAPASLSSLSESDTGAMRPDLVDRLKTVVHRDHVTTSMQNGALSPTLSGADLQSMPTSASTTLSPTSPQPSSSATNLRAQLPTRTRGRTPAVSRQVSSSGQNSASPSTDRGTNPNRIGTIGICALDSKARSKPSRNILNRLLGKESNGEFDVIIFGDKIILDENVENWPVCDFLISFFSDGFPLEKAIEYARLRKPFCVNDLPMQTILWDRRLCLRILDLMRIETPPRLEVNRDGGPVILSPYIAARCHELTGLQLEGSSDGRGGGEAAPADVHMEDDNDTLVVNGQKLTKPFVEKPVSGEDHNINIYYPKSQGGGGRRLFRKVNNKSSEKDEALAVPRAITEPETSYVYEQFLKVENAEDVKAYTVGPDFCHAETRKSPVVDGVVKRNPNGKELRYVTSLSKQEQESAAKIATGFGQRVCGFDLLRVGEKSYVIDVNGWSFVKDNNEYYDQCARILKSMFVREKLRWEMSKGGASGEESAGDGEGMSRDVSRAGNRASHSGAGAVGSAPRKSMTWATQGVRSGSEKENVSRASTNADGVVAPGHRSSLKSVLHSRSLTQLRDHVTNAAHKVHPSHSKTSLPSSIGTASPVERQTISVPASRTRAKTIGDDERKHEEALDDVSGSMPARLGGLELDGTFNDETAVTDSVLPTLRDLPLADLPAPAVASQWKLKGMVAVIRHADRTPKQKFKFTFHTKPFVDLLKGHREEVLLVGEQALESVSRAVETAMQEGVEDMAKLGVLRNALRRKRGLVGTKVQIKPMFKKPKKTGENEGHEKEKEKEGEGEGSGLDYGTVPPAEANAEGPQDYFGGAADGKTSSAAGKEQKRQDSISEVTLSRVAAADNNLVLDKLQLVMKWGGEPTHSARYQASDLGENMRNDLLLMNRDVISNVNIFTSSERRVTTSAQIFAGAFLDQQKAGSDTQDESVVDRIQIRKDLLDDSNAAKDEMDKVKKRLKGLLRKGEKAPEQFAWPKDGTPEPYLVVRDVVDLMKFMRKVMSRNFSGLRGSEAVVALEKLRHPQGSGGSGGEEGSGSGLNRQTSEGGGVQAKASEVQSRWCTGEDAELFRERWEKLFAEFVDAEKVDPSRISELYDTMKFDALHNRQFLEWVFTPRFGVEDVKVGGRVGGAVEVSGEDGGELRRTESQLAKDAFLASHEEGTGVEEDGMERGGEGSLVDGSANGNEAQLRTTMRTDMRRRSQDLMSVVRPAMAFRESYFNLFTGDANATTFPIKSDARLDKLKQLYTLVKILFDFIGPQEYGITNTEKLEIGLLTSLPLLKEIVRDLEEVQAGDDARSFLYFTKESHIYTLLNCILEGGIHSKIARNAIPELDYLSQICFELYEAEDTEHAVNPAEPEKGYYNYSIRIAISPGCHTYDPLDVQLDSKHTIGCAPRRTLMPHTEWSAVLATLKSKYERVKLPRSFTAVNLGEKSEG
ncbi:hypothetical protein LTR62_000602 [Meristemomyces frigidus]|uniref:Inositol hexakisphosphate and diphosphoinositol-pentakisphosphate kinase n=1 Tax=Meristemomyces frigidus TaxID=1508187 RepID=A0AAN7TA75_9PEZI|nr:hypothetical protein LTR62_000602 [Meristemomyces frigidus]